MRFFSTSRQRNNHSIHATLNEKMTAYIHTVVCFLCALSFQENPLFKLPPHFPFFFFFFLTPFKPTQANRLQARQPQPFRLFDHQLLLCNHRVTLWNLEQQSWSNFRLVSHVFRLHCAFIWIGGLDRIAMAGERSLHFWVGVEYFYLEVFFF